MHILTTPGVQQPRRRRALRRRPEHSPVIDASPHPAMSGGVGPSASFGLVTPPTPFLFCLSPFVWVSGVQVVGLFLPAGRVTPASLGLRRWRPRRLRRCGAPHRGGPSWRRRRWNRRWTCRPTPPPRRTPRRRRGNQVGHPGPGRRLTRPSARVTDKARRRRDYFLRHVSKRAPVPCGRRSWRPKSRQPARGLLLPRRRAGGHHPRTEPG